MSRRYSNRHYHSNYDYDYNHYRPNRRDQSESRSRRTTSSIRSKDGSRHTSQASNSQKRQQSDQQERFPPQLGAKHKNDSDLTTPHFSQNTTKSSPAKSEASASSLIYEVEAIVADATINDLRYYEVKWKGFNEEFNTWQEETTLDCPDVLNEYLNTREKNTADLSEFYMLLKDAKGFTITVSNRVDNVGCPEGFAYINENIYSDEIPRPCSPLFWCDCEDGCRASCPCVRGRCYDDDGIVSPDKSIHVMECSSRCTCIGKSCVNRVVQKGSNVMFGIQRFEHKGWGVVTRRPLKKGTFVAEYVGEVVAYDEAERRGTKDTALGITYLFDLDKEFTENEAADFSVDAKTHGNIAHFFNHSCEPNMETRAVYIEHRDPRLHRLVFFASRDVKPGEELTFDYSPQANPEDSEGAFPCFCMSAKCRKFICF